MEKHFNFAKHKIGKLGPDGKRTIENLYEELATFIQKRGAEER